jgi:hypothetical protein
MGPVDVASIRLTLVALIQASCQLFENPPFDPSLGRPFHSCLRVVRNTERCGLLRVSIWIGLSVIGSRMVASRRLAYAEKERRVPCFDQIRLLLLIRLG